MRENAHRASGAADGCHPGMDNRECVHEHRATCTQLGLTSARMFWEGEDQPIVIEYTSADDGERYRVEYTIVGEELQSHLP